MVAIRYDCYTSIMTSQACQEEFLHVQIRAVHLATMKVMPQNITVLTSCNPLSLIGRLSEIRCYSLVASICSTQDMKWTKCSSEKRICQLYFPSSGAYTIKLRASLWQHSGWPFWATPKLMKTRVWDLYLPISRLSQVVVKCVTSVYSLVLHIM